MEKKKIYRVRTQYVFEGVFEVLADNKEDARQKVLQDCGLVMGGNIHSTLPDEEVSWAFSTHPKVSAVRSFLSMSNQAGKDKEQRKPMPCLQ